MESTSLDSRLRESREDSISVVVNDPAKDPSNNITTVAASNATTATDSEDASLDASSPQQQLPPLNTTTTPNVPPHTPSHSTYPHPLNTPTNTVAIAPTPTTASATPHDPNDPKRPRACEACRGLKVKCEPDPLNPDGPCKRCAKAGRECLVTQPTRKRQKKTDSRVAELEKKIDALTASLHASRSNAGGAQSQPTSTTHPPPNHSAVEDENTRIAREWGPPMFPPMDHVRDGRKPSPPQPGLAAQKRKFDATKDIESDEQKNLGAKRTLASGEEQSWSDIVDRGIITIDQMAALFKRYTDSMAIHLPAVVFPSGTTAAEIRMTRPILFLSIMSVASSETPNMQRQLVKELMQIFADKIIMRGNKSLELVQAIIVSVVWYFPPEHFEELKFYQMVHLAAVMALDMGLGRRKNSPKSSLIPYTWRDHPFRKHPLPDSSSIESRRTWLAVYFLASNVAMALHRPNLIRWQSFMTECMDILESSPEAAPSDKYLCHLVWTHRLAEEVGIQFSMDDPSVFINITEQKVQYALRGFERDLVKYSESIREEDKQPSLLLSFSVMSLYMHEIALQTNEERTAPSSAEALRDPIPGLNDSLTPAHISALSSCLTAIDGIFETFLALDESTIRCLPIFNLVRVSYAVVVLIKIYFSATSPNSELGKVINKDNMKVAEYLDSLYGKFRDTAASDKSRPASKFLMVLDTVRNWFHKGQQGRQNGDKNLDNALKTQASRSNSVANQRPNSQDSESSPNTSHYQQPHVKTQPEYNSANTPLQLLSEIATGNGPTRNSSHYNRTQSASNPNNTSNYSNWMGPGSQLPYMYGPNSGLPTSAPATVGSTGQPLSNMPWMAGPFGGDMNYLSMGDGFEQAMDLTLTGFGGNSPSDWANYENSWRMMAQNDTNLMAPLPDDFSANSRDEFPGY
ncbi:hypothetical protein F5B22DRAFT_307752 [Xylaria bambusicola]|uniref:uncharacterized protein n=1 Tax=Xylaria bambusicola TaxID=326684 RepID=UPI0020076D08|nr:uncharacterized protein F5B22DRAFT_307752 [Xylaria bambusicola]KAI0512564.1 hypothetical protein F5B22DRAFT_307752 [Xylaria bambusicola]